MTNLLKIFTVLLAVSCAYGQFFNNNYYSFQQLGAQLDSIISKYSYLVTSFDPTPYLSPQDAYEWRNIQGNFYQIAQQFESLSRNMAQNPLGTIDSVLSAFIQKPELAFEYLKIIKTDQLFRFTSLLVDTLGNSTTNVTSFPSWNNTDIYWTTPYWNSTDYNSTYWYWNTTYDWNSTNYYTSTPYWNWNSTYDWNSTNWNWNTSPYPIICNETGCTWVPPQFNSTDFYYTSTPYWNWNSSTINWNATDYSTPYWNWNSSTINWNATDYSTPYWNWNSSTINWNATDYSTPYWNWNSSTINWNATDYTTPYWNWNTTYYPSNYTDNYNWTTGSYNYSSPSPIFNSTTGPSVVYVDSDFCKYYNTESCIRPEISLLCPVMCRCGLNYCSNNGTTTVESNTNTCRCLCPPDATGSRCETKLCTNKDFCSVLDRSYCNIDMVYENCQGMCGRC